MKLVLLLLTLSTVTVSYAQIRIIADDYTKEYKSGIYKKKSTDTTYLNQSKLAIKPQKLISVFTDKIAYLVPSGKGIVLFKSRDPKSNKDIAGKLIEKSLIEVDTLFYNHIYEQKNDSAISFDVWYAIRIDGQAYYTDFQIHDHALFKDTLLEFKQLFILFAQSQGYDYFYATAYPEAFHVLVLGANDKNNLKVIYESTQLPFEYGNEFWDENESISHRYDKNKKQLHFEIHGTPNYKAIWSGKELKQQ